MSIYSRDYMRDEPHRRARRRGPSTWSIVTWLLLANVATYLVQHLFFYNPLRAGHNPLALSFEALAAWQLWTPLTYQFSHAHLLHLLGNMIGLFFLGRMLLQLTDAATVARVYFLGGLAGGALQLAYNGVAGIDPNVIGASGSVLAIVIAAATLVPRQSIHFLLFFILPIRMTMRQIALLLVAINGLMLLFGGTEVAVMAHFGGMLFGWLYIRYLHRAAAGGADRARRPRSFLGIRILRDGEAPAPPASPAPRDGRGASPGEAPYVNADVDAILDKINAEGFQSLTDQEKRILERSSERLSRRLDKPSREK